MGKEEEIEKLESEEELQKKTNDSLDMYFDRLNREYIWADAKMPLWNIRSFLDKAKEKNIPETEAIKGIDKEKIQKAYELALGAGGRRVEEVETISKRINIPVRLTEGVNSVREEAYIRFIHNSYAGHAEGMRKQLIERAEEEGVDIDYDKVVKMEFRDFLKIPKERWLDQEKEVKVDDESVKVEAHGFFEENRDDIEGKFIMAKDSEKDETRIIFDSTMGEHKDIGAKYDIEPIGGGWMTMNPKEKTITLDDESENFGAEPREKTIQALKKMYLGWKIDAKSYSTNIRDVAFVKVDFKKKIVETDLSYEDSETKKRIIQTLREMYPGLKIELEK